MRLLPWTGGPWREKSGRITNPAEMAIFQYFLESNFAKEEKEYTKAAEKIYIEDIKLMNGIVDLLLGYDNTYLMSIIRKQPPFMKGLQNFPGYEISDKDMMDFFK